MFRQGPMNPICPSRNGCNLPSRFDVHEKKYHPKLMTHWCGGEHSHEILPRIHQSMQLVIVFFKYFLRPTLLNVISVCVEAWGVFFSILNLSFSKLFGGVNHIWVVVSNIFYFHRYLGKIPILTNIFQTGWNHQPDICWETLAHSGWIIATSSSNYFRLVMWMRQKPHQLIYINVPMFYWMRVLNNFFTISKCQESTLLVAFHEIWVVSFSTP